MGRLQVPILPKPSNPFRAGPLLTPASASVFRRTGVLLFAIATMAGAAVMFITCRTKTSPDVTIWAWERNEDLTFTDSRVKVAYFAGTIYLRDSRVSFRPRRQQLKLRAGASTMPVFRIVSIRDSSDPPPLSSVDVVVNHIVTQLKTVGGATKVQIDFDARQDERQFYRCLLEKLRRASPAGTRISITALASWLLDDRWLTARVADEVVAMLFSMGPGRREVLSLLKRKPLDAGVNVDIAVGISANERDTNERICQSGVLERAKSVYIFNSHPWTESRFKRIENEVIEKWSTIGGAIAPKMASRRGTTPDPRLFLHQAAQDVAF